MSIVNTIRQESIVKNAYQGFTDQMEFPQMIQNPANFVNAILTELKVIVMVSVGNAIAKKDLQEKNVTNVYQDIEAQNVKNVAVTHMERWTEGNVSPIANAR